METKQELTISQKKAKIISQAIREKWDIIRLSRNLSQTISATSQELASFARMNSKMADIFYSLGWPIEAHTTGHIYAGDKQTQGGENSGELQIGDHVIVKFSLRNGKNCEMFKPVSTTEYLFYVKVKRIDKDTKEFKNVKVREYFTKSEVENGKLKEWAAGLGAKKIYVTGKHRKTYRAGHWVGTPLIRSVISVNYNWK